MLGILFDYLHLYIFFGFEIESLECEGGVYLSKLRMEKSPYFL